MLLLALCHSSLFLTVCCSRSLSLLLLGRFCEPLCEVPRFVNCTFRRNVCINEDADRGGGAVFIAGQANAYFEGCTFER